MVPISMLSPCLFNEIFEFESPAFLEGSRTLFPMSDHPEDTSVTQRGTKRSSGKRSRLRLSKEKTTSHGKSLLSQLMVAWAEQCLARPWLILVVALLTAGAAGVWTSQSLGYKVSRVDLLDPDSEYNKLWIDYIHEFGEDDDAVVVVEGTNLSLIHI